MFFMIVKKIFKVHEKNLNFAKMEKKLNFGVCLRDH